MAAIGNSLLPLLKRTRKNASTLPKDSFRYLTTQNPIPKTFINSTHSNIFFKQNCTKINEKH